jgi:hypothetical protein
MATTIKAGIYVDPLSEDESTPEIYIDHSMIQIYSQEDMLVVQISYEELRGILAIMAAEQEKTHLRIQAIGRNN